MDARQDLVPLVDATPRLCRGSANTSQDRYSRRLEGRSSSRAAEGRRTRQAATSSSCRRPGYEARRVLSASPAHVETTNASTASSSSQYTPSEAMSSPARMQQERSVVLVLVSLHAVAVAALIIKFSRSLQSAPAAAERRAARRCPGPDVVCVYQPLVRRTSCGDEKRCHEALRQPAGASSAELDVFLW